MPVVPVAFLMHVFTHSVSRKHHAPIDSVGNTGIAIADEREDVSDEGDAINDEPENTIAKPETATSTQGTTSSFFASVASTGIDGTIPAVESMGSRTAPDAGGG